MSSKPPGRRGGGKAPHLADWHLWSDVKKTVAPLPGRLSHPAIARDALQDALNAVPAATKPHEPVRLKPIGPVAPSYRPPFTITPQPARGPEPIEPGIKRRVAKGQLPIDATLDLHGMTQEGAHQALLRFIPARAARGDRTVLVITGKGLKKTGYLQIEQRGILRHAVPRWLGEAPLAALVAGVEAAHIAHGGEGALYVRLRAENRIPGRGRTS